MAQRNHLSFTPYIHLTRLNKPIGIWLLLWPTLWALWLAAGGPPSLFILFIFMTGTILMRSIGCIINDLADQSFDRRVKRTCERPLASGKLTAKCAYGLMACLTLLAFLLVLQCNWLTIQLSMIGVLLTLIYPFLKRITHLPQVGLGMAFSWGIPMSFAAVLNTITPEGWQLFFTCLLWPIIYDTFYAMADREDDLKIGVKSTAILFNKHDKKIIAILQCLFILLLMHIGYIFSLHVIFYFSLLAVGGLFIYQQWLIKDRHPNDCFQAFLNNHWVGLIIFIGIYLSYR